MAQETLEQEEQIYVWSKTERAGDIVTVEGTDGEFTVFTDGTRVFTSVLNEVATPAENLESAELLAQPFIGAKDSIEDTVVEPQRDPNPVQETTSEVNVMLEMLRKISAKNTIEMPLNLNIPSHEVYKLFKDQMDISKEELNEQILALVMSQIDNLQEQLKPQAEEFIKQYYDGRRKSNRKSGSATTKSGPDITY
tara:strand:- start:1422 stop:2006 length:585 start_codon:yes stop_codon:yes gene_type:complete